MLDMDASITHKLDIDQCPEFYWELEEVTCFLMVAFSGVELENALVCCWDW